jgi:hypothetical protein
MRTMIFGLLLAAGIAVAASAQAHEVAKHQTTVMGELVDTGCYLGHNGQGAGHAECAALCINGGMPMGVLTRQGTLYLVTMNHDNPDFYNKLKKMAGKTVAVTGTVFSRSGMKAIEVTTFKMSRAG